MLASGTFLVCAQLTFPYARVRDRLVAAVGADDGGRLARGWFPGRFTIHGLKLAQWKVDSVEVRVGLAAMLDGRMDLALDAALGPRRVAGTLRENAAGTWLDLQTTGTRARLTLPAGHASAAIGTIEVACDACRTPRRVAVILGVACVAPKDADLVGGVPFMAMDCSPPPAAVETPVAAAPPTQPVMTQVVMPPALRPEDIGDVAGRPSADSELPAPPPATADAVDQPWVREF